MSQMRGVHMRFSDAHLLYIEKRSALLGVNKSEVVRQLINKAIKKDGKNKK